MIQEKDFLYRVPVKNALVTAPGKQVRNPEILVDLEGGEFMHGNILDANSTNKLIDQSVKDAIDNSIENSNYLTKDLLEAETSARTKSDEDLNAKIKAEQTRAEGKEKEISDKLAIVDGDSNTEGSFRKAITEKADASALANEVTRATVVENDLRTAIDTKVDASALGNYVLTTALNQQVDTLNAAISDKQDAGSYVPYDQTVTSRYRIDKDLMIDNSEGSAVLSTYNISAISNSNTEIQINPDGITMRDDYNTIRLDRTGIILPNGDYDHVLTSNASTINITQYALKTELPTVPTNVSQLTNDSNFITQQDADAKYALSATADSLSVDLSKKQDKITVNGVDVTDIETADITKLRTIVIELIDALTESGLIRQYLNLE